MPINPYRLNPLRHCRALEFRPIIGDDRCRIATQFTQSLQLSHNPCTLERRIRNQRQVLPTKIINHRQDAFTDVRR